MEEVVISGAQPHSWLRIAADEYSATVRILDSKILRKDVVEHLFDMNVKAGLSDQVLEEIRKDKDVLDMEIVKSQTGRIHGSITTARCTVCKEVASSKCFLASVAVGKGEARWTILGNHPSILDLLNSLEQKGIRFQIAQKRSLEDRELLTTRQEQILFLALQRGYFDFPKGVGLKELSAETGVKTSTLTEILRRGQKKILREYFSARQFPRPRYTNESSS